MTINVFQENPFVWTRPPENDDELWEFVYTLWNIQIPRTKVCRDHIDPFTAFADAFFARHPVSVWKASRGFGGKTTLLGVLAATEAAALGAWVTILGGSAAQSMRVTEVIQTEALASPRCPPNLLMKDPTRFETDFVNGAWVRALMASQRSVRGPHPQRLRLDEIDEMEMEILEAAQGQPTTRKGVDTQTVMSSTHQYPDKTMTAILKRAVEKGWPIPQWCYKETIEPHGWLPQIDVSRKRMEVTQRMWDTEYDLQEPSFDGRAIDTDKLELVFDHKLGVFDGKPGEYIEIEAPDPKARYATGVDWAKKQDWTVIATFRHAHPDSGKWRMVAFERMGRMPWPEMVKRLDLRLQRYKRGAAAHDATGIGDVVGDLIEADVNDVVLTGRTRDSLWSEWIGGIESLDVEMPRIEWMYEEHKYVTMDDLFGKGHTPDSFAAGAIGWGLRKLFLRPQLASIVSFEREASPWEIV